MLKDLIDKLLGRKPPPPPPPPRPKREDRKPRVRQIYMGPIVDPPEFAEGLDDAELIQTIKAHVVCKFPPQVERQRIYKPGRPSFGGDLDIVYEGIAAMCPALKNYGLKVAQEDGLVQNYRYLDLNHIFACCCGEPHRCRFYQVATEDQVKVSGKMRQPGASGR